MEKTVDILLTDEILFTFFEKFSLQKDTFKKLGDFENYVFEVYQGDETKILRLTHSSHRKAEEIIAELEWMNYLHHHQINVPMAFESNQGQLVETIEAEDGTRFYACVFSKAEGKPIKIQTPEFNQELFYAWGKEIGKIHFVTKNYHPKDGLTQRANWDEEDLLVNIEKYIPSDQSIIVEKTKALMEKIHTFPITKDNFGLIHTDIHSGNFFFDGKQIHVFDFDDSAYIWFASDIAIPLYYSILYGYGEKTTEEKEQFAKQFISAFIKGYATENVLPAQWKEHLPYFLRLRDVTLYSVLYKKVAPEERTEKLLAWMKEMATRIKNEEAIIELDRVLVE